MQERQPIERLSHSRSRHVWQSNSISRIGQIRDMPGALEQESRNFLAMKRQSGAPKIKIATQQQIHIAKQLL